VSENGPSLNSVVLLPYQRKAAVPKKAIRMIKARIMLRQDFILKRKVKDGD